MNSFQNKTRAFIIRIWIEPSEMEASPVVWRGVVEVVVPQEQESEVNLSEALPESQAFNNLDTLVRFLIRHMEQLGIPLDQMLNNHPG